MKKSFLIIGFILLLLSVHIANAEQNIIRDDQQKECLDYALEYQSLNPEWSILLISDNYWFRGLGHYVNYQIDENKVLYIHDGMTGADYSAWGWQYNGEYSFTQYHQYYHLFVNEEPQRRFRFMRPNAMEIYETL